MSLRAFIVVAAALCALGGLTREARALTCTVSVPDLTFAGVNPFSPSTVDGSVTMNVQCNEPIAGLLDDTIGVCLYLDAGSGGTDGSSYRYLLKTAETLRYNLYKDGAHTQIWGSQLAFPASGGQRVVVTLNGILGALATGSANLTVHGQIPSGNASNTSGTYSSTFTNQVRARYSFNNNLTCDGTTGTLATTTFVVRAAVDRTCVVDVDDVSFGNRATLSADIDVSTPLRTTCTNGLPYTITLGLGGGTSFAGRRMRHDTVLTQLIGYQLYRNAGRSEVWGDGTTGGTFNVTGTGSGALQATTVYGRVAPQTTPIPGDYRDSVIVTVTY